MPEPNYQPPYAEEINWEEETLYERNGLLLQTINHLITSDDAVERQLGLVVWQTGFASITAILVIQQE